MLWQELAGQRTGGGFSAGEINVLAEEVVFDRYQIPEGERLRMHRRIRRIDELIQAKVKPAEGHGSVH